MALKVYNTLTGQKEIFESLTPNKVKMYICGPTVYDYLHVGNFRGVVFFNLVRNFLEKKGYKITYVLNYTDVDDKIIKKAQEEKISCEEVAQKYIKAFEDDIKSLKLKAQDHNPCMTDYMGPVVAFIEDLLEKEKAYVVEGPYGSDVNFSVKSFKDYGKLSGKNIDELKAGFRIDVDSGKRHPADFVLWKASKAQEPSWPSPWGPGRPGWHIECSTMSQALLGEQIDIHGGGLDLLFPHHENEIAQSEARLGKPFVKYWMHNNMLEFEGGKMSKSLGNTLKARDFFKEYGGEIYKYMMLSAHYRSVLDFSTAQIEKAISSLGRIYSALALAESCLNSDSNRPSEFENETGQANQGGFQFKYAALYSKFENKIKKADQDIEKALEDDFNTSEVMARLFEIIRFFNQNCRKSPLSPERSSLSSFLSLLFSKWIREKGEIMSLFQENPSSYLRFLDDFLLKQKNLKREDIDKLVQKRNKAREEGDYKQADTLRDQLQSMDILLQDSVQGTSWEVSK